MNERPKIGVGVLIFNNRLILLGKRKNSHGTGMWSPPGGHLEFGETPEKCAQREVLEETGIQIKNIRRGPFTNDIYVQEKKHYITIFIVAEYANGIPQLLEPEKCEGWHWFSLNELPEPLFIPLQNLLAEHSFTTLISTHNTIQTVHR